MKHVLSLLFVIQIAITVNTQEKYRKTANAGFGISYHYGVAAALSLNYDFDVFKNFILASSVSISSYRSSRYWGNSYYTYEIILTAKQQCRLA